MPRCTACDEPMASGEEIELSHGSKVHMKCFKCAKCSTQLTASDLTQGSDKVFYCKEHKGGFAKQLQERARRSLRVALKGGSKMFQSPGSKKQKPPAEVGESTSLPADAPPLTMERESFEEVANQSEEHSGPTDNAQPVLDEFETVVDNGDDVVPPSSLSIRPVVPAERSPLSSVAMAMEAITGPLRRTSTVASAQSVNNFSTSPSMVAYGEVASIIPTIGSTISGGSHHGKLKNRASASVEEPMRTPQLSIEEQVISPHLSVASDRPEEEEEEEQKQDHPEEDEAEEDEPEDEVAKDPSDDEEYELEDEDKIGEPTSLVRQGTAEVSLYDSNRVTTEEETVEFDEEEVEDEEEKHVRAATDPLNMLTTAVARELEVLPQNNRQQNPADEDAEELEPEQPWVYPPAFSGVSPIQISVVDPDHLWMFIEGPLLERMTHSKVGGAKRAKFVPSESLKPMASVAIYSRYRNPYVHIYLVKCDSVQEYTSSMRARLKAFREDVGRREDPEWLMVLVESAGETKKVLDKMKQDFMKDRVVSVSVSEDARWLSQVASSAMSQAVAAGKIRRAGDGQWGDLAQRVGTCIVRAYEHRRPIYRKSIDEELEREMDFNYFNVFTRSESLAFASLQCDKYDEALELYVDLNLRFKRGLEMKDPLIEKVVRCGMTDESGSSVKRMPCHKLLFPAVSARSTEQDAVRAQIHRTFPARIFDVERLPFRDLIGTSTVSGIQLQMYLVSRIVLNMLGLGRAREAIESCRQFVFALRNNLRLAYPNDFTTIDAWVVAASLEIVAAGHACASVFAAEVDPADRVGMCLAQAILLERSRIAMEQISERETAPFENDDVVDDRPNKHEGRVVPLLARKLFPQLSRDSNLPLGLARAFFGSPDAFRTMYSRLLEASAAHFVAAGRFRFAAALTHLRAWLLWTTGSVPRKDAELLFEDAGRWWGGGPRTVVSGEGTATVSFNSRHDDWPSLEAVTCLFTGRTERVAASVDVIGPQFRRTELAAKVNEEIMDLQNVRADMLIPLEICLESFPKTVSEDDTWKGRARVQYRLRELAACLPAELITKVVVRFKHVRKGTDAVFKDVESYTKGQDLRFDMESIEDNIATMLGSFIPCDAFVYIQNQRFKCLLEKVRPVPIVVVERPFPYECDIVAPRLIISGAIFGENAGENDVVSGRQELSLCIHPRSSSSSTPTCEAVLSCNDSTVAFSETKDAKVTSSTLTVRFDTKTERKFSLVMGQRSGQAKLFVDMKTNDQRKSVRYEKDIVYQAPLKVTHEVRFAGHVDNDVACITLVMENNFDDCNLDIISCSLTSTGSSEEEVVSPLESATSILPFHAKLASPLRQSFFIHSLDSLVPHRVGGRALILLRATTEVNLLGDTSELQWYVPLVVRRAEVVRSKWKEGEALNLTKPGIEHAMFGIDWKELDNEVEGAPVISINDNDNDGPSSPRSSDGKPGMLITS